MGNSTKWLRSVVALSTVAVTGGALLVPGVSAKSRDAQALVTVSPGKSLGKVPQLGWGINTMVSDFNLLDPSVPRLLRGAGIRMLRFPGGSEADAYHWKDGSLTPGSGNYGVDPQDTFTAFLGVAKKAHATPIITVNYGSNRTGTGGGDPKEAAAWVRYSNVKHHFGVKYWEIGNENYGSWEVNDWKQKGPTAYGQNALTFIKDMKAADPTIKVGIVLTCPGDGQDPNWNPTVLKIAGRAADFVIVHWYAFGTPTTDSAVVHSTDQIPSMMATLKEQIRKYAGLKPGHTLPVMLDETNSVANGPGPSSVNMVGAVFLANDLTSWLENGVANVDWWDLHNYGSTSGDYGVLENSTEQPYATYHALQMLNVFEKPGDEMLTAKSTTSNITVHASKAKDGQTAVLVTNRSPKSTYQVQIRVKGMRLQGAVQLYDYANDAKSISRKKVDVTSGILSIPVAPYSIATVILPKGK